MIIQISAGFGPVECSIAVEGVCNSLLREYESARLVLVNRDYSGNGFKSCIIDLVEEPSDILGTIQWICKSPVRMEHKRKNWFISINEVSIPNEATAFSETDCTIETMHCGGHGGQNVNKVESGVRIKHIPTGIVVECTEERSQFMNKKQALRKIQAILIAEANNTIAKATNENWKSHTDLVRGNPIRVYEGLGFMRKS